ncbi:hypothetical protein GQ57_01615 [Burkholderia sp. MSh2]|nr:hypothetical protein GQ57_01615 [Burkholderia sp. MSh2]
MQGRHVRGVGRELTGVVEHVMQVPENLADVAFLLPFCRVRSRHSDLPLRLRGKPCNEWTQFGGMLLPDDGPANHLAFDRPA